MVSAACWFLSFYAIYGTFNPAAPYGGYTQSTLANAARGLTGLAIDQQVENTQNAARALRGLASHHQFGILPNAPIYLAGFAGLWMLGRSHRRLCTELVAVIV